ncbi:lipase family protein [Actinomadura atramentaria]|uniref:lipase family protein n=1 Tax=Actinomadura atramentaria TaxID=1990 RepID=UPI00036DF388|nr:lipase family protein [Actinomadura atramentaria]
MSRRFGRWVVAVAVWIAAVVVPGVVARASGEACGASVARVRSSPSVIIGEPGDVLACRMVRDGVVGARAWVVQYVSTDVRGQKIAVAGTVVVPDAPWTGSGARPLVAYAPGGLGLGARCSFSRRLVERPQRSGTLRPDHAVRTGTATARSAAAADQVAAGLAAEGGGTGGSVGAYLRQGFAVVVADGVGRLDGQTPAFGVGAAAGHALLDGARAALRMPAAGLDPGTEVGLSGYSVGGSASLWAAQLAASYTPGLRVVGGAAGGVPGDLRAVAASQDGGVFAGYLVDVLVGLSAAYPSMPFDELLNEQGRRAVADARSACGGETLSRFFFTRLEDLTTDRLTPDRFAQIEGDDGRTWGQILADQRLGAGVGAAGSGARYQVPFPVLQYRGAFEEVVPASTEDATATAYCRAGIATRYRANYPGEHAATAKLAADDVARWLRDRFAGVPDRGTC